MTSLRGVHRGEDERNDHQSGDASAERTHEARVKGVQGSRGEVVNLSVFSLLVNRSQFSS